MESQPTNDEFPKRASRLYYENAQANKVLKPSSTGKLLVDYPLLQMWYLNEPTTAF